MIGHKTGVMFPKALFMVLTVFSMGLFAQNKIVNLKIAFPLLALAIMAFFNRETFQNQFYLYHLVMLFCGITMGVLIHNNLDWYGHRVVKWFVIATAITQLVIVLLNPFGFEFYAFLLKLTTIKAAATNLYIPSGSNGSMSNVNHAGALLAMCAPFLFNRKFLWLTPIYAIGVYLTASTAPVLAIIGAILIYLINSNKWRELLLLIAPFVALLSASIVPYFVSNARTEVWEHTISKISLLRHLHGHGIAHFAIYAKKYSPGVETFRQLHNEFLEFYFAFGIIGLILFKKLWFELIQDKPKEMQAALMSVLMGHKGFVKDFSMQLQFDKFMLDLGTDQQHPGPLTHQRIADIFYNYVF